MLVIEELHLQTYLLFILKAKRQGVHTSCRSVKIFYLNR